MGGTIFARNRGVASITKGCIISLRRSLKNPEIKLIHTFIESFYPRKTTFTEEGFFIILDEDKKVFQLIVKMLIRTILAFTWRFLSLLQVNADFLMIDKVLREFKNADVVINLSYGDMFAYSKESYNQVVFFVLAHQCLLSILLKKPLIFFPQSVGPFNSKISRFVAKFILDRCTLIMVREGISKYYLTKMNIVAPVKLVPDPSFLVEPVFNSRISEILTKESIRLDHPTIGIAMRSLLSNQINILCKTMDFLLKKLNATVIFIPHDSKKTDLYHHDPRYLADLILNKIEQKCNIYSIKGEYTVEELMGLIGKCDIFIGSYMHANISALRMNVPVIAISYSHKTDGIMELAGLNEFVIPYNYLEIEQLIEKIKIIHSNLNIIKKRLKQNIQKLRKKAAISGELVREVMSSNQFRRNP